MAMRREIQHEMREDSQPDRTAHRTTPETLLEDPPHDERGAKGCADRM
jgi:hypothetical protein